MKNKKIISLVITGALMVSYAPYAFAASEAKVDKGVKVNEELIAKTTKISKEEAKKISKKILKDNFNINIDEKQFTYSIELRQNYNASKNKYLWEIQWNSEKSKEIISGWVSIDADTGKIYNVNLNKYNKVNNPAISKISEEDAKKIAENFVKKINPKEFKEVELVTNNPYGGIYDLAYYHFSFRRKINNIPLDSNTISVQVNGATSEVTSYNYIWDDDLQLPNKDGIVDLDKADKILKDNIKVELAYKLAMDKYGEYGKKVNPKLVYLPQYNFGQLVDAKKGKLVNYDLTETPKFTIVDLTAKEKEEFNNKAAEVKNYDKELDREGAEKLIKDILKDTYGKEIEILNLNYRDYSENSYMGINSKSWSASFRIKGTNKYQNDDGHIEINPENGELISLYRYYFRDMQNEQPKVSKEEGYKKAINILAKYYPDKIKNVKTEQSMHENKYFVNGKESYEPRYYFNFNRIVDGIVFQDNSITVSIDAETGEAMEIRSNWNKDLNFPKADKIISKEEAKEAYNKKFNTELQYSKINVSKDDLNPKFETSLVYKLVYDGIGAGYGEFVSIDAFSGKYLNYNGEEINDNLREFNEKIKGTKYEKELSILGRSSIVDTKTFKAEKAVTKLDVIKMLVNAKGYRPYMLRESEDLKFDSGFNKGEENYGYLQMAVLYGIVDNAEGKVDLNEELSREELAGILVKSIGYDELAKNSEIFLLPNKDSKDVTESLKGYVSIAQGLKIMELKDGKFNPKDKATMLEAAISIYNVLDKLQKGIYY